MGFLFGTPDIARMLDSCDEQGLIRALHHRDPAIASAVAKALGQLKVLDAVDPLYSVMVNHKNPNVCRAAGSALKKILTPKVAYRIPDVIDHIWMTEHKDAAKVAQYLGMEGIPDLSCYFNNRDKRFREKNLRAITYLKCKKYSDLLVKQWEEVAFTNTRREIETLLSEMQEGAFSALKTAEYFAGNQFKPVARKILQKNSLVYFERGMESLFETEIDFDPLSLISSYDVTNDKRITKEQWQAAAVKGVTEALAHLADDSAQLRKRAVAVLQCLSAYLPPNSELIGQVMKRLPSFLEHKDKSIVENALKVLMMLGGSDSVGDIGRYLDLCSIEVVQVFQAAQSKGETLPAITLEEGLQRSLEKPFAEYSSDNGQREKTNVVDGYYELLQPLGGLRQTKTICMYWMWKPSFERCVKEAGMSAVPYLIDVLGTGASYYRGPTGYFTTTISSKAEEVLFGMGNDVIPYVVDAIESAKKDTRKLRAIINLLANFGGLECLLTLNNLLEEDVLIEDVRMALDYTHSGNCSAGYSWVIRQNGMI